MSASPKSTLALPAGLADEEVRVATRVLESIAQDRALLSDLPEPERRALLIAAGLVSRPSTYQEKRLVRAMRKARREETQSRDKVVRAQAGIRMARLSPVFLPPPKSDEAGATGPELEEPKSCYVCKEPFTR